LFHILFEQVFDLNGEFCYLILLSVILDTVIKNKLHVVNVLLYIRVHIVIQFPFNCSQIHWLLDYLEIVIYSVFCRVYWLLEVVTSFWFWTGQQNSLSDLYPGLLSFYLFHVWHVHLVRSSEFILQLGITFHQFLKLLKCKLSCVTQSVCSVQSISDFWRSIKSNLSFFRFFSIFLLQRIALRTFTIAYYLFLFF